MVMCRLRCQLKTQHKKSRQSRSKLPQCMHICIRHVSGAVQAVKASGGSTLCGVNYCAMDKYSAPATAKGLKNCTDSLKVPPTQMHSAQTPLVCCAPTLAQSDLSNDGDSAA